MQYAIEDGEVYVLEANPESIPVTVPLVSKVCNIKMVKLATDIMTSYLIRPSVTGSFWHWKRRRSPHYIGVETAEYSRSRRSRRFSPTWTGDAFHR